MTVDDVAEVLERNPGKWMTSQDIANELPGLRIQAIRTSLKKLFERYNDTERKVDTSKGYDVYYWKMKEKS